MSNAIFVESSLFASCFIAIHATWGRRTDPYIGTHSLYQPTVIEELGLVFDVIARDPCLYLVSQTLQLLDLRLQIQLQLFFLSHIGSSLHLVVDAFK